MLKALPNILNFNKNTIPTKVTINKLSKIVCADITDIKIDINNKLSNN
jgi:hypothetical protein